MEISLFLSSAVIAGTPLLFATLGCVLGEKVGNLNLGIEGMMLMGAIGGFIIGYNTGNVILAFLCSGLLGAVGALIYAVLTVSLRASQVVTGLALAIFGSGFSSFIGKAYVGQTLSDNFRNALAPAKIPLISDIPFIGAALFNQSAFVYFGYLCAIVIFIYLNFTKYGLNMKMIGENPYAADAAGINVSLYKYANLLIGGALCGLGGSFLSLVYIPSWAENVTAGRGWIAVALVIFIGWNPLKAIFGAILFGGLDILGIRLQGTGIEVNQYFIAMLPYAATIIVLVLGGLKKNNLNSSPQALGEPYFREDR
ncbi:ABC-type transporter, integral membrane subunit [Clostridium sp. DL-VIII]|uniref:ABC transporter permease n=1 Tax=Clostridium sp. DL-VIII TaxID=641107 RepID=UPI00023AF2C8|nr:ABC transporter permease [Clostridium sp. DL-VIII]EHI97705.1 ABC-type transporter, integral membrane subunit [Clostridium sp. DL-VIII]